MRIAGLDAAANEIPQNLSREFVQNAQDLLLEIEALLARMRWGQDMDATFLEFWRHIHSIKGQGGTFGFPTITRVAHMLEDYIETLGRLDENAIVDLQTFVDRISQVLEAGEPATPEETDELLDTLPRAEMPSFSDQIVKDVRTLVIMPKSTQRAIIGRELVSCGFHLSFADDALSGLSAAIALPPRIVFASYEIPGFPGVELANVFRSVKALSDSRFIVLTSYVDGDPRLHGIPDDTGIIHKDADFAEQMVDYLLNWGFFGQMPGAPT